MSHRRILHVSDLHIGVHHQEARALDSIKRALETASLTPLDYLVVCGNLTQNASSSEFTVAARVLADFANHVLKKEDQVPLANRVLIVPGERDIPKGQDEQALLQEFNQFSGAVLESLGAGTTARPISMDQPLVRRLKDLTLIGLPYWQGRPPAHLERAVRAAATSGAVVAYHATKPTILVSSMSPLMELAARQSLPSIRSVLEKDLRIDFHLFGASPVVLVALEPFAFSHVGISTGPRPVGTAWPFRFNVLEIKSMPVFDPGPDASGENFGGSRSFVIISRNLEHSDDKWDGESRSFDWATYLGNEKSVSPVRAFPHRALVKLLNNWAAGGNEYLRIDYLPGSGVDKWLQRQDNSPAKDLTAKHIVYRTIEHDLITVDADNKEEALRRLVATMEELAESLEGKKEVAKDERWAVFHDQVLPRIDPEYHSEWVSTVKAEWQKQIVNRGRFLYLVPRTQHNHELTRLFPYAQASPALDNESRRELLKSYDAAVPFRTHELEHLTGGCLGFGAQLLEEVQNLFIHWPEAKEILDDELSALIGAALESGPMQQLAREFNYTIERLEPGGHVLAVIRRKVSKRPRQNGQVGFANDDTSVTFTRKELMRPIFQPARLDAVLELLVNHGVIAKDQGDRYQILALAPFLVKSIFQADPTRGGISGAVSNSPATRGRASMGDDVFISYSRESVDYVKQFVNDLKSAGVTCWFDDRLTERGGKFEPRIQDAIKHARYAVLVLDDGFAGSHYIHANEWPAIELLSRTRGLEVFTLKVTAARQKQEFEDLISLNKNEPLALKPRPRRRNAIAAAAGRLTARWKEKES